MKNLTNQNRSELLLQGRNYRSVVASEAESRVDFKTGYVVVVAFYSSSHLGQEAANGPVGFLVKMPPATCLPHTVEASHCPFNC